MVGTREAGWTDTAERAAKPAQVAIMTCIVSLLDSVNGLPLLAVPQQRNEREQRPHAAKAVWNREVHIRSGQDPVKATAIG